MMHLFFTALMFYTRIPCPKWTQHSPEVLNRATVFFPVIGWIVGSAAALVFFVASSFVSPFSAALLSTIITVLLTGAFHEDGFSDTCDGFGGGWDKERILVIMKDSRIGVYGALGLLLIVLTKLSLIHDLFTQSTSDIDRLFFCLLLFINAHTLSRYMATCCIYFGDYARANDDVGAKAKPLAKGFDTGLFLWASVFTALPLLLWVWLSGSMALLLFPVVLGLIAWRALKYFDKWIGGYTGDCLGAVQQVTEVCFYLTTIVLLSSQ